MIRRDLVRLAAPALLFHAGRASAQAPACFNPDALPAGQKSLRRSLGFELQSRDPQKNCGGCAYYTPKADGCGTCVLFSGGPVAVKSVCRNWSKRG